MTLPASTTLAAPTSRRLSRALTITARWLLGLPMTLFGLNGFLNFIPPPEGGLPPAAATFSTALLETGYMMPLIGATQLIAGLLLLVHRFVPLALTILTPFFVNALAFHLFLEPTGLVPVGVFLTLHLYLVWAYRAAFRPLLTARADPA